MNSAAKSGTWRSRAQHRAVVGHERCVRSASEAKGCSLWIAAARPRHHIRPHRSVKLRFGFPEQRKTKFVDRRRAQRPGVARVDLLHVRNDAAAKIAQGTAGQLEDRERIEGI